MKALKIELHTPLGPCFSAIVSSIQFQADNVSLHVSRRNDSYLGWTPSTEITLQTGEGREVFLVENAVSSLKAGCLTVLAEKIQRVRGASGAHSAELEQGPSLSVAAAIRTRRVWPSLGLFLGVLALAAGGMGATEASREKGEVGILRGRQPSTWTSLISAKQLMKIMRNGRPVVVDVRTGSQYAAGHLPGSINLPAEHWRTPAVKPGEGRSQDVFRRLDGSPDVEKYEKMLGGAGLRRKDEIVICGNHSGKADGSVPAMILHWLGHRRLAFLDGIGTDQWIGAGGNLARDSLRRPVAIYAARPIPDYIWNLEDVLAKLHSRNVVFVDTRTPDEFAGVDRMNNKRGGHIPGAVNLDHVQLLQPNEKIAISPLDAVRLLKQRGVTPDKTVVLYCQTATRVSLLALMLRDLGYRKVGIYDASWFEYGNLDWTPVTTGGDR